MVPIVAGIVSMLADKGLELISGAIDGGAEKAKEFIEEKTGISLDKKLTDEQVLELKKFEAENEVELKRLALMNKQEDNRHDEAYVNAQVSELSNARDMQKAALQQDDVFSKRYVYYLASFWSVVAVLYIFAITFINVPEASVRFADTTLGFVLGTVIATIIGYFFGASIKKG